jgi:hypothetical protein
MGKFNRIGKLGNTSCKPSTHKLIKVGHRFETVDIDSCTQEFIHFFSLIATKEMNNNIETKKKVSKMTTAMCKGVTNIHKLVW